MFLDSIDRRPVLFSSGVVVYSQGWDDGGKNKKQFSDTVNRKNNSCHSFSHAFTGQQDLAAYPFGDKRVK